MGVPSNLIWGMLSNWNFLRIWFGVCSRGVPSGSGGHWSRIRGSITKGKHKYFSKTQVHYEVLSKMRRVPSKIMEFFQKLRVSFEIGVLQGVPSKILEFFQKWRVSFEIGVLHGVPSKIVEFFQKWRVSLEMGVLQGVPSKIIEFFQKLRVSFEIGVLQGVPLKIIEFFQK